MAAAKSKPRAQSPASEVVRLLQLLSLIKSTPGIDRQTLCKTLAVDERSIYRYIGKLKEAGVDIARGRGGYSLSSETFLPPLQLAADEALSLMALCQSPAAREQLSMLGPLERVVSKLTEQLPAKMHDDVVALLDNVKIQTAPGADASAVHDVYSRIKHALADKKVLACEYDSRGGSTSAFHLQPYALYFGVRAWYVIGRHIEKQDIRTLRLSRFASVDVLDEHFTPPRNFSVERHFANAWIMVRGATRYDVELIFAESMSETISETRWHKTQEIEHLDDGGVRFKCQVDGLDEIVWWVLSMGASCRVVAPMELRLRVMEQADRILDLYSKRRREKKRDPNSDRLREMAQLAEVDYPEPLSK